MRRTEYLAQVIIVGRVLVVVPHNKSEGSSGGLSFEYTGKEFDPVVLFPLGYQFRLPGFAAIEFVLNKIHIQRDTRRTSVNHPSDSCAVRFAKRGKTVDLPETVHTFNSNRRMKTRSRLILNCNRRNCGRTMR